MASEPAVQRRLGLESSAQDGRDHDEVEFGAFLRSGPRTRGPRQDPARPYSPPPEARPVLRNGKVAPVTGRMRQGAPRLGGLGLGGVGATSTPSTPPRSSSQATLPTPPTGSALTRKIKRSLSPPTEQDVFQASKPHRPTPVVALSPATALPQRPSGTPNERPFLSAEIVKPTFRREAFALDRPVPDGGLGPQVAPVPTAPDSPVPMDSPTSLDHFTSSVIADDASPELSHLRWFPPDKSLVSASLARRAEAQEICTSSLTQTDNSDVENSSPTSSRFGTPESTYDGECFSAPGVFSDSEPRSSESVASEDLPIEEAGEVEIAPETTTDASGPPTPLGEEAPFRLPFITTTTTTTSTPSPSSSIHAKSPSIRTVSRPSSYTSSLTASRPGDPRLDEPSTTFSRRSSGGSSMTTYSDESSADPYVRRELTTFVRTDDDATPLASEALRDVSQGDNLESEQLEFVVDTEVFSPRAASMLGESPVLASQPDDPPAYELELVAGPVTPESETASLEPVSPGGISLSDPVDESFFYKSPARRPSSGPHSMSVVPGKSPQTTYSGLGLRLPSSINPNLTPTLRPDAQQAPTPASSADSRTTSTSVLVAPVLIRIPKPPSLRIIPASPSPDTSPVPIQELTSSPLPTSPLVAMVEPADAEEFQVAEPIASKTEVLSSAEEPSLIAPLDSPPSPPLGTPAADMLPLIDSTINNVGIAVAGLLVSGGIAIGARAWSGFSAVASAGWNWRLAAAPTPTPVEPRAGELATKPAYDSEFSEGASRALRDEADHTGESDDDAHEVFKSPDSGVVSTEWGEVHFPVPEGFLEDFEAAMAELGLEEPNEAAEAETAEEEAQEVAYQTALRQHREALSPPPAALLSLPTLDEDTSLPSPPSKSPVQPSLGRLSATAGLESRDDILDFLAPEFSQRRDDMKKAPGRERPLYFGNNTSSSASISSISPSMVGPAPSFDGRTSGRPQSIMSQESATSREKRRGGLFGAFKKSSKSPSIASQTDRSSSVSLSTPTPVQATFASPSSPALLRRSTSHSPSVVSTTSTIVSSTTISSIEKETANAVYISYGSGRRRGSQTSGDSPDDPVVASSPANELPSRARKSSIRLPATFDSPSKGIAKSRRVSAIFNKDQSKTIYSVRFANAHNGLGLRSVAEDEAERGGGEEHAAKWVGVGRGRYGNLTLPEGESADQLYVDQVETIKKSWRAFGSQQSRDWARVKID